MRVLLLALLLLAGSAVSQTRMQAAGADPGGNTPEEFARFIRDDQARWSKLMREAGIKPE